MPSGIEYEPLLNQDAKQIMKERGWDTGCAVFGVPLSEATAKVLTAATLLTTRSQDFGFPYKEFKMVTMDFNDKDNGKLGVWSPAWRALSSSGPMPGLAMEGQLKLDSCKILAGLAKAYVDKTLTPAQQEEVMWWIDLNERHQDKLMEAVIHWGWAGFHRRVKDMPADRYEKAMAPYEKTKKDLAWQKSKIKEVHEFFSEFEGKLKAKPPNPVTGGISLVAGKTTLADCAVCNWYRTFHNIAGLEMQNRYPLTAKYYLGAMSANTPAGGKEHYDGFAMFGKVVHIVNSCGGDRGCCGNHDINNPVLWDGLSAV